MKNPSGGHAESASASAAPATSAAQTAAPSTEERESSPASSESSPESSSESSPDAPRGSRNRRFAIGLARAFAGALIFSLPLLMTMEMWWIGFYIHRLRLALFVVVMGPLLVGLSYLSGFEETVRLGDDVLDALTAYAVGCVASAATLFLLGILTPEMSLDELVGKVCLQAVPASIGALLAESQLGGADKTAKRRRERYGGELLLMAIGAVFLAFNLAPTEEMVIVSFKMTGWRGIAVPIVSLLIMHSFVYSLEFSGQHAARPGVSAWGVFMRFTAVGYSISLLISAYVLWTYGRFDDASWMECVSATIVLGLPASIGAAAARLVL